MRAVGLTAAGAPLQMLELEMPEPAKDELLVRVQASSINPVDTYIVRGTYRTGGLRYPVVPGRDVCGVVERAGATVTGFAEGDEVIGCWTRSDFRYGSWADYLAISADCAIVHKPAGLDPYRAAALPLAAVTAQLAVDQVDPAPGEATLIVGAAGAVGCYAVQLAAKRGAHVIATARPADESRLRRLGAAETIDYTAADIVTTTWDRHPLGIPVLIDIVNDKPELLRLAALVPQGGRVTSARFAADRRALSARGITASNVLANDHGGEALATAVQLAQAGELELLVSSVCSLSELPALVPQLDRGGAGKVVVAVAD